MPTSKGHMLVTSTRGEEHSLASASDQAWGTAAVLSVYTCLPKDKALHWTLVKQVLRKHTLNGRLGALKPEVFPQRTLTIMQTAFLRFPNCFLQLKNEGLD